MYKGYKGSFYFYEVGGKIRDEILGIESKDIDYVAVPNPERFVKDTSIDDVFNILVEDLKLKRYEIYLITPRCYTIRAKMPASAIVADFVLARHEIGYKEGTREPISVVGTLEQDLARRDFTVNAMAKDLLTGKIIDPFGGLEDIKNKILKTPIDGSITFSDDPLRLLRVIRFAITKGFSIDHNIQRMLHSFDYEERFGVVSEERIREELHKCFKYNTSKTLSYLIEFGKLRNYIFTKTNLWLKPTNEKA
jgi:poly(A) polymerase